MFPFLALHTIAGSHMAALSLLTLGLTVGMALSLQSAVLAKRRALNWVTAIGGKPFSQGAMKWFWSFQAQFLGSPDMQIVEFAALSSSEVVIADAACKLYALVLYKATATATYTKATDSATTSSDADSEIRIKQAGAATEAVLIFPQGLAMASGITMQGNTAPSTGTGSGADGGNGFAIVGAA
jgi:hypothetical protein